MKLSGKTLKFGNVEVNKKKIHASKQPIALDIVNVNQILISDNLSIVIQVLNILLATNMIILLGLYTLFYFR